MMHRRAIRFTLLLALALSICSSAMANSLPFSVDDLDLSLEPGYAIYHGAWLENELDTAFLLLGSEEDNAMKLAIAQRTDEGGYILSACSKRVITYDEYCIGSIALLDTWFDRRPYFTYEHKQNKLIYLYVEEDESNQWKVTSGGILNLQTDEKRCFYTEDTPNELIVYDFAYPQICFPTNVNMCLEEFDIAEVEETVVEAIQCLHDFSRRHNYGEQDETYRIIW